jgi:uncharacterized membrane protein
LLSHDVALDRAGITGFRDMTFRAAGPASERSRRRRQGAVAGYEAVLNGARALTLVGLFASAAALWIYLAGMPTMKLCARTTPSACQSVIVSTYGSVLTIPLPVIGLLGFAVMGLTLFAKGRWALLQLVLGVAGAIAGAVLLAIQLGPLGQLCLFCVIADVAAVALGCVIALGRLTGQRLDSQLSTAARRKWAWRGVLAFMLSVPAWLIAGWFEAC